MFGWLKKLYEKITGVWKILPDSVKEKIINAIVDGFEHIFREYYKNKIGDTNV